MKRLAYVAVVVLSACALGAAAAPARNQSSGCYVDNYSLGIQWHSAQAKTWLVCHYVPHEELYDKLFMFNERTRRWEPEATGSDARGRSGEKIYAKADKLCRSSTRREWRAQAIWADGDTDGHKTRTKWLNCWTP